MNAQVFHVDAVNEHFSFLHVVIAWNQIYQGGFSTSTLTNNRDGLTFGNDEVNVFQNPLFTVFKRYVLEFYLMVKTIDMLRIRRFLNGILRHQNLIDSFHGSQSFRNVVTCLRELFQWVDDTIENHHVIDKRRTRNGLVVQDKNTAKPQYNYDHHRTEKLAHRVSG